MRHNSSVVLSKKKNNALIFCPPMFGRYSSNCLLCKLHHSDSQIALQNRGLSFMCVICCPSGDL